MFRDGRTITLMFRTLVLIFHKCSAERKQFSEGHLGAVMKVLKAAPLEPSDEVTARTAQALFSEGPGLNQGTISTAWEG